MEVPSVIIFSQYSEINRWRPLNDTLHIAIPWERTSDIGFVERCVVNMLGGDKTAGVYQHRHI
jgi:hypothetical protein